MANWIHVGRTGLWKRRPGYRRAWAYKGYGYTRWISAKRAARRNYWREVARQ